MTFSNLIQTSFEIIAVIAIGFGFYYEDKLVRFERKAAKYIKCFFIACFICAEQKFKGSKHSGKIIKMNSNSNKSSSRYSQQCGNYRSASSKSA